MSSVRIRWVPDGIRLLFTGGVAYGEEKDGAVC